jgi:3-oxoacyl-[acyl-carrier-protein] synthase-3
MGVVIKATGISTDVSLHDSIEHAVRAGSACIDAAGIDRNDIGLLINVGIYRNENIVEPANACLIQNALGINPMYVKGRTSFSFDILNGACGFLNAAQVAGAVMKTRDVKYVMVVSSDVHPSKNQVVDFPYRNIGAAALLEWSDDPRQGFQEIIFRTSRNGLEALESIFDYSVPGAREHVHVKRSAGYHENLIDFTARTMADVCEDHGVKRDLRSDDIIFVTSQPVMDFGLRVLEKAGLHGKPVGCLYEKYGDCHSSALTIAFHEGRASRDIGPGDRVVFVGAGAGLTASVGLYLEKEILDHG